MSEEIKKRGRQKGTIQKGYITITDKLRIRVEMDCIIWEELVGEDSWGNYKYFTSWDGVIAGIIRKFTMEKLSKKELSTFKEAKKEILDSIKEVKSILLGEINIHMKSASGEIKEALKQYI